jgi:uncharacterized protein
MNYEIEKVVAKLGLKKLWDNDYVKEDYCSDVIIQINDKKRVLFNWAYYLIPQGCIFPLHKLLSDESWHYCLGGPIDLFLLQKEVIHTIRVGPNIFKNEQLFYIVKKNTWFAAKPAPNVKFSLISHCVSPGWDPEDDIAGFYAKMIKMFPKHHKFIKKYCWPADRKVYTFHESYKSK